MNNRAMFTALTAVLFLAVYPAGAQEKPTSTLKDLRIQVEAEKAKAEIEKARAEAEKARAEASGAFDMEAAE